MRRTDVETGCFPVLGLTKTCKNMKTFFFTTTYTKSTYGSKVLNKVYQVKNNLPILIGETKYNTQSYRGHDHEAMQVIIDAKLLPLNCMDRPKYGYINYEKRNKVYRLIELR